MLLFWGKYVPRQIFLLHFQNPAGYWGEAASPYFGSAKEETTK